MPLGNAVSLTGRTSHTDMALPKLLILRKLPNIHFLHEPFPSSSAPFDPVPKPMEHPLTIFLSAPALLRTH